MQRKFILTLNGDTFLRPVFHLPREDGAGPHTDDVVSYDELQGVETKHFNPEEPDLHIWMRVWEHQRDLQNNW